MRQAEASKKAIVRGAVSPPPLGVVGVASPGRAGLPTNSNGVGLKTGELLQLSHT